DDCLPSHTSLLSERPLPPQMRWRHAAESPLPTDNPLVEVPTMKYSYYPLRLTILTVALSLIAAPSPAASRFAVTPIPVGARVTLNGRTVAVIRTSRRGVAPADRAARTIQRLEAFLAAGGRPIAIQPRPSDEGAAVYAGETLVEVVT